MMPSGGSFNKLFFSNKSRNNYNCHKEKSQQQSKECE